MVSTKARTSPALLSTVNYHHVRTWRDLTPATNGLHLASKDDGRHSITAIHRQSTSAPRPTVIRQRSVRPDRRHRRRSRRDVTPSPISLPHPSACSPWTPRNKSPPCAACANTVKNYSPFIIPIPPARPLPSATDLAQANYPETLYLIISLHTRGVLEMQGFFLRDDAVTQVPLEIVD